MTFTCGIMSFLIFVPSSTTLNCSRCFQARTVCNLSHCFQPSPGITIPDDPIIGCECEDGACDIKSEAKCCPGANGHYFPYTKFAKLRVGIGELINPLYDNFTFNFWVSTGRFYINSSILTLYILKHYCFLCFYINLA